jgi:methionyl-tRNA formyltransferase
MTASRKLVFFGNERLATAVATKAPTLRALVHAGYEIPAVISNYTPGISREDRRLEIVEVAHAYHIPVLLPDNLKEIISKLKSYKAEAAVLVAYGKIIPQEVIDIFPKGIINIHPSLLPKYRGPTPIETAILDGAHETGVSLMRLVAKMDTGPVFAQEHVELSGNETKQKLADKLLDAGSNLLKQHLPAILEGWLTPKPQIDAETTYTKLIKKDDGILDFSKPAEVLEREVRAYAGWPKSRTKIHGHEVVVTKTRTAKVKNDGDIVTECKPGYLEILELIAPSGKTVSGAEFIRGYSSGR